MKHIAILIPVGPEEPLSVVEKSCECIRGLEKNGFAVRTIYVLDKREAGFDERAEYLRNKKVEVLIKNDSRGRRAGAINYVLGNLNGSVDYIAIFDVDSRPKSNFLLECIAMLEKDTGLAIVSAPRYVTNARCALPARIVAVEYRLIEDFYILLNWSKGFILFNGLIGVLDGKILENNRLRDDVKCEDTEFTERIYLSGRRTALTRNTRVGEQAAVTWVDLYHQRVRWYTGAYEGLRLYLSSFLKSELPGHRKFSWLAQVALPFVIVIFIPLLPLYSTRIWGLSTGLKDFLERFFGVLCYVFLLQLCGVTVIIKKLGGGEVDWGAMQRSDI